MSNNEQLKMADILTAMGAKALELLAPKAGERILDIGCGTGVWAEKMMNMGCEVVGIDIDEQAVAAARKKGIDARLINVESMNFDNEFDAVFSNATLHWVSHPVRVSDAIFKALKKGGRFAGECGEKDNLKTVVAAVTYALEGRGIEVDNLHPWVFLAKEEAEAIMKESGFEVKSMEIAVRNEVLPGTLAEWLPLFAGNYLSSLHPKESRKFMEEVVELCRPKLLTPEGKWFADYVRLRFSAVKP